MVVAFSGVAVQAAFSVPLAHAACHNFGCDNTDPLETGCSASSKSIKTAALMSIDGSRVGTVDARYSTKCASQWTRTRDTLHQPGSGYDRICNGNPCVNEKTVERIDPYVKDDIGVPSTVGAEYQWPGQYGAQSSKFNHYGAIDLGARFSPTVVLRNV